MAHPLARLVARRVGEAQAEDDVVEPPAQASGAGCRRSCPWRPPRWRKREMASSMPYIRFTFCFSRSWTPYSENLTQPWRPCWGVGTALDQAHLSPCSSGIPLQVRVRFIFARRRTAGSSLRVTSHGFGPLWLDARRRPVGRPATVVAVGGDVVDHNLETGSQRRRAACAACPRAPTRERHALEAVLPAVAFGRGVAAAATWAATGVDLREPLKPRAPADEAARR